MQRDPRQRKIFLAAALFSVVACFDTSSPTHIDPFIPIPFDAGVEGLPEAEATQTLEVRDGDTVRLAIEFVAKWISGHKVRMLAYNRSIPGPVIKAPQRARITLLLTNKTNLPTSLHSHGLRLDNKDDGVPGETQALIDSGETHAYQIHFPDPGVYWYHPHYREDYQLELGLYGNYLVAPADSTYWPPVNREVLLVLDDILLEGNVIRPFYQNRVDFAMMGRFGNVLLVNGDTDYVLKVKHNEMIRFYVTNVSHARVYNLRFSPDYHLNVLGADNGRYEYPFTTEFEFIAPSERLTFQVHFKDLFAEDTTALLHWPTAKGIQFNTLARFAFEPDTAFPDYEGSFTVVKSPQAAASIDSFRAAFAKPVPDQEIMLWGYMDHSKIKISTHDSDATNRLGIEWYDHMGPMNSASNDQNMSWFIQDMKAGLANHAIHWQFKRGEPAVIRIRNDHDTLDPQHPDWMFHRMPHPIHFHGQRFLVLREKAAGAAVFTENKNLLGWKDTHLIGAGITADILLDASNPGDWMFHCHIAEHLQSDMMGHFSVVDSIVGGKIPFDWALSLRFADAVFDSLRQETILVTEAIGAVAGRVNGFDPSMLEATLTVQNVDNPALKVAAALASDGAFSFPATGLLGQVTDRIRIKASVKPKNANVRPVPDTLRLTLDRRIPFPWSLDLDLGDAGAFQGLARDTSAAGAMDGEISGRFNGYDSSRIADTLAFQLVEFSDQNMKVPLDAQGKFAFPAMDLLAGQDGLLTLKIVPKLKGATHRPVPNFIAILLSRGLAP